MYRHRTIHVKQANEAISGPWAPCLNQRYWWIYLKLWYDLWVSADWNRSIKPGPSLSTSCNIASRLCYHVSTHSIIRTGATAAQHMSSAKLFKKMEGEKSPRCTDAIPDNDSAVWGIKHSMPKWSCWDRASQEGRRGKSCTLQHIWCIKSWDLVCKNKLSPPFFLRKTDGAATLSPSSPLTVDFL